MHKLLENYKEYKSDLSSSQLDRIRQLAKGQKPEYLFISCSDSRVMPNLFTKSEPGSLFELQNAGNIIPAIWSRIWPRNGGNNRLCCFSIESK